MTTLVLNGHHRRATAVRVALLFAVVTGAASLVAAMLVPSATALTDVVNSFADRWLDPPPLPEVFSRPAERTVVLAADGSQLATLLYEQNRVSVALDDVPLVTQNAVLATEDVDFWSHRGINHRAILRALITNIRSGEIEQGGSTITQQYVKNKILTNDLTIDRKIKEALYAVDLEQRLSKREILELYLNETYFGEGVYGIGTAAEFYFSKPVNDLTLAESATLAGIIRSPIRNNPVDDPDASLRRRNIVLDQMVGAGFVTREQADGAQALPLGLRLHPLPEARQPFFVEWVKQLLLEDPALGDTPEERFTNVFQGGLTVRTTLDSRLQYIAETTLASYLDDAVADPMGAIVSTDPHTGAVVAMAVGPKRWGTCPEREAVIAEGIPVDALPPCEYTKVNPVVPELGGSGRQAGSSFKPFLIAAALEAGFPPRWSLETSSGQEIPGCVGDDGEPWTPNNYGGEGTGGGYRDMYEAVRISSNIYHARLVSQVGPEKLADMAHRLGIVSSPLHGFCSEALGTADVFPLEMASAFGTFANDGVHCAPYAVEEIYDRDGELVFRHSPDCERAIERSVSSRVTDILRGVVEGGTGVGAQIGRPAAGKTGTTDRWKDAWFVGYVPQLSTAVWMGFENHPLEPTRYLVGVLDQEHVTGGAVPAPMWGDYMERALEDTPVLDFPAPAPVGTTTVPSIAGLSLDAAEERIRDARLSPLRSTVPHYAPVGTIVGQNPAAGTETELGSPVEILISDGNAPLPTVPNVVGMSQQQAIDTLTVAGYGVYVFIKPWTVAADDGRVVDQNPFAGTTLVPGEGAVVTIGVARFEAPPSPTPRPPPTRPPPTQTPTEEPPATEEPTDEPGNGNGNGDGGGGD